MQSVVGVAMVPEAILEKLEPMQTSPALISLAYFVFQALTLLLDVHIHS